MAFKKNTVVGTKLILILILFITVTSCDNIRYDNQTSQPATDTTRQNNLTNNSLNKFEINCDSIYKNQGITLHLIQIDTTAENESQYKFRFIIYKRQNGQQHQIYSDIIESTAQEIKFADFNNDNIKDILVQKNSDVRSNWTYYLYIVDKNVSSIRKIKGFEEIKNPNYLSKYDLIDNMVMSGRNWTSFYKILADSVKDYEIVIYDVEDEKGNYTYDTDYKRAIKSIVTNIKIGQ